MESVFNYLTKLLSEYGYLSGSGGDIKITAPIRAISTLLVTLWCIFVYLTSGIICNAFSKTYNKLSVKEKMFWNLAIVRGIYGAYATFGGIYEKWFDEDLWSHKILNKTLPSHILAVSHFGFFIYECATQTWFDIRFKTFNKELHIHHLISLFSCIYVFIYEVDHYYCATLMILEMSTPSSCLCFLLIKAKMENTQLWRWNQFVLIHLFHMRSLIEWLGIYELYWNWDQIKEMPTGLFLLQASGLIISGFYLTPYWTYRKTEQLFTKSDWTTVPKNVSNAVHEKSNLNQNGNSKENENSSHVDSKIKSN